MRLKAVLKRHREQVLSSIKMIDIEERFDLHFSRFFGLFFAKAGKMLSMTPTQVSILSLAVGVIGGGLLYFQDSWKIILIASFLITWAGVLDSADGQLARMTGQSTELGRIIDGVIDNLVFMACYLGGTFYFMEIHGWPVFILAILAGLAHSTKSAIYEFYKAEYLLFAGPYENYNIEYPEDFKRKIDDQPFSLKKVIMYSYLDYTKRQFWFSTRTRKQREKFRTLAYDPTTKEQFTSAYRKINFPIMFWWALVCGTNTHRTLIMVLSIFGRFDIYLAITLITIIPFFIINRYQKKLDRKLDILIN